MSRAPWRRWSSLRNKGESHGRPVIFMYPSSIAVYGLPSLEAKHQAGKVQEDEFTNPTTMYGCNKLYCEQLGPLLRPSLQAVGGGDAVGQGGLPLHSLSRTDFRGYGAVRRHFRFRAGNGPRGGTGQTLSLFRAARYAHSLHGDAGQRGGPAELVAAPATG